ncbi:MAG: hypothetical protein R3D67_17035 [Hyphomicrobiaceae bacterium]
MSPINSSAIAIGFPALDLAQITTGIALGYQDWQDWLDDFRARVIHD